MSYNEEYRKRVIEYRLEGKTLEETRKIFKVSISTISKWQKIYEKTGEIKNKQINRGYKKINPAKLEIYI